MGSEAIVLQQLVYGNFFIGDLFYYIYIIEKIET